MTVPIGIALLFLMAVAPVLPWRKASEEVLARGCCGRLGRRVTMIVAVALGARGLGTVLAFGLGAFAGGSAAPAGGAGHPPAGLAGSWAAPTAA